MDFKSILFVSAFLHAFAEVQLRPYGSQQYNKKMDYDLNKPSGPYGPYGSQQYNKNMDYELNKPSGPQLYNKKMDYDLDKSNTKSSSLLLSIGVDMRPFKGSVEWKHTGKSLNTNKNKNTSAGLKKKPKSIKFLEALVDFLNEEQETKGVTPDVRVAVIDSESGETVIDSESGETDDISGKEKSGDDASGESKATDSETSGTKSADDKSSDAADDKSGEMKPADPVIGEGNVTDGVRKGEGKSGDDESGEKRSMDKKADENIGNVRVQKKIKRKRLTTVIS